MSIIDTLITDRTRAGHYDITDLNRVGGAMYYIADRLRSCGWDIEVSPRTDWVWTLRPALGLFATTPEVPTGARPFDAQEANDIEKILVDVEDMVERTMASWYYCGDLYAGEV